MKRNNNKKINKNLVDNLGAGGGWRKNSFSTQFYPNTSNKHHKTSINHISIPKHLKITKKTKESIKKKKN